MEKLTNKRAYTFEYNSRYSGVPYYYDTERHRDIFAIGKQISFDTPYVTHVVKASDTLDKLALHYYSNPSYWWAIAYFNKINDPFIDLAISYKTLKIPTITSIIFED